MVLKNTKWTKLYNTSKLLFNCQFLLYSERGPLPRTIIARLGYICLSGFRRDFQMIFICLKNQQNAKCCKKTVTYVIPINKMNTLFLFQPNLVVKYGFVWSVGAFYSLITFKHTTNSKIKNYLSFFKTVSINMIFYTTSY
jgi:hypothetical protein